MHPSLLPPLRENTAAPPCHEPLTAPLDRARKGIRPFAPPALEQSFSVLGDELARSSRVRFSILVSGRARPVHSFVEQQIYCIAAEATRNALRHSEATSIEIDIEYLPHKLRVVVRDNGCGINGHALSPAHSGFLAMRERALKIGGELRLWSRQGAGTEVEIAVPSHVWQTFLV